MMSTDNTHSQPAEERELNSKKQELKIGFADYKDGLVGECLCEFIKCKIGDKYNVRDRWSYYGNELLEFAETGAVGMFLLNQNCITNTGETLGLRERLEYSYKIITQIKTMYPSILLATYSGWSNQEERAKLAGVDFYRQAPLKLNDFMPTIEKYLEIIA